MIRTMLLLALAARLLLARVRPATRSAGVRGRSRNLNATALAALNRGRTARNLRPLARARVGSAQARSGGT
jgi:hypothetical protein